MKVILHDLNSNFSEKLFKKSDAVIEADGKYAPCQGCFNCWTKHPAECFIKDKLQKTCRILGRADELVIITKNLYGAYSTEIKNIIDRTIGSSIPLLTYRKGEVHHILRYGVHNLLKVLVYGDITKQEKETFVYMVKRNVINTGYRKYEINFFDTFSELEKNI
ncbi:MAG: flavodoxin family protein [Erysipelotrichaceae bacterium]